MENEYLELSEKDPIVICCSKSMKGDLIKFIIKRMFQDSYLDMEFDQDTFSLFIKELNNVLTKELAFETKIINNDTEIEDFLSGSVLFESEENKQTGVDFTFLPTYLKKEKTRKLNKLLKNYK